MPRRSRLCGFPECGKCHYARGYCRQHYDAEARKKARRTRQATRPNGDVLTPEKSAVGLSFITGGVA